MRGRSRMTYENPADILTYFPGNENLYRCNLVVVKFNKCRAEPPMRRGLPDFFVILCLGGEKGKTKDNRKDTKNTKVHEDGLKALRVHYSSLCFFVPFVLLWLNPVFSNSHCSYYRGKVCFRIGFKKKPPVERRALNCLFWFSGDCRHFQELIFLLFLDALEKRDDVLHGDVIGRMVVLEHLADHFQV